MMSKPSNTEALAEVEPLSPRSIALSVLLGSHPPRLPARGFVALAELFDIAPGTMRTALSRLAAAGELALEDGWYELGGELLDRQRSQDAGRAPTTSEWNGHWHLTIAADDQRELTTRRSFRQRMTNHRFGELRPDIWMRPANEPAPAATPDVVVSTGPLAGRAPDELAHQLWDLEALADAARRLVAAGRSHIERLDWDRPASIADAFPVAAATVRFLRAEPRLPAELTPARWPVAELRTVYDELEAHHSGLMRRFLSSLSG